jgi:hypothetical protein
MTILSGERRTAAACTAVAALLLAAVIAPSARADAERSLLGHWPLDEGAGQVAHDVSGNGNDGVLGATAGADTSDPAWVPGRFNSGLRFDGDDYVQIPDSPTLEDREVTIGAFFRGDRSPGRWRYLVSKGATGCEAASYGLYTAANGGLGFYVSTGSQTVISPLASKSVWDGAWHHAAGSFDGQTVRLFVDGVEVGHGSPAPLAIGYGLPDGERAYLGAFRGGCDLMLEGEIDELAIWGSALTSRELQPIVAAGPGAGPAPAPPSAERAPGVGHPKAVCKRARGEGRCRISVSFPVWSAARVRVEVSRLRPRRKARRVGAVTARVRPPRATIRLPVRLGGKRLGPGRYRLTLIRMVGPARHRIGATVSRVR